MTIETPPVWLLKVTAVCYIGFFAYAGIVGIAVESEYPDNPESAGFDSFSGFWDVVTYAFEFVTFSIVGGSIPTPPLISGVLFLVCTVPWILYFLGILQEVIDTVNPF